ncbi:MATE family efflux transporter [Parashewanella spongiae]|uniref:MATE family efflux transporter n=1 Tax=Parashewanella spongiae TaxID=342950 RepID=A0A3A6UCN8_9GAMM|nr:MATE family efflux transporter [Parashewanella spongiae]MCL1078952.1 MATE family efflux transporter [Parashewanella spongiae]RJY15198.1 MATE family efflux transporter [Parashewanella spongiae]
MKDKHGLLSAPIGQVLLKLSLPNLLGIFTVFAFNLVDTFFISRLGTVPLAAISFTFPVTLIVISIAIGVGAAVSTNLGRLIGSGQAPHARVFLHDALLLSFLVATGLCLIGSASMHWLFTLMGANAESLPLVNDYLFIWYLGAPLLVLLMVGNQGLRATGDTRSPAMIMTISALINLVLDPLLIFGIGPFPRLEMQGAAIASVISWIVAIGFSGHLLIFKRKLVIFAEHDRVRLKQNWQKLAHIARPAALMYLINPLANAVLMMMLARIDHSSVAAFGAGTRIESLALIVVMAVSSSLVPFIAQNLGAGQQERASQALQFSLKFILLFQCILYIPLFIFSMPLAQLFSSDPQVLKWLNFYIIALPCAYGPLGVVMIFAASLNAYHKPLSSLVINLSRLLLLMLPLALLGSYLDGVKGLLLALPVTNLLMGGACFVLSKRIEVTTQ